MSTRMTLRYGDTPETGESFHLFTDWLDECQGTDLVHLQLTGVAFTVSSSGHVEIAMSRLIAEQLGLVARPASDVSAAGPKTL